MKRLVFPICIAAMTLSAAPVFAGNAPTVVTDSRYVRGATRFFGRATWTANGTAITERGFCISATNPEPTIADQHSTTFFVNNGRIQYIEGLEPATIYYARAYGMTADSAVGYGGVIKFCTLPKGTVTWGYDNGGSSDENARINAAVGECADYWNELTSISGLYLNVHYGSDTQTADCSYGGWMRVGPNSSYQRTGTIMHEALHAIGVGTCDLWRGSSSPMRSGSGTGLWYGTRANELVKFWDNNASEYVTGDATHVWASAGTSYSVNGANEDSGTKMQYTAVSLMAQALCEDGLPPTTGHPTGLPYYSFVQDDDAKYYLKNESSSFGLYDSYLKEMADGSFQWVKLTASEATANDSAAWRITFNPATQLYAITNVATGHSVSYANSTYAAGASAAQFQFMPSRNDVADDNGNTISSQRAYWFIASESSCLSAAANGAVSSATFNIRDNAKQQRWLILTAQQAAEMEDSGLITARNAFKSLLADIKALADVPHVEVTADADATFAAALASLTSQCDAASTVAEAQSATDALLTAGKTFLTGVRVASADNLFDLTFMLTNTDFTNGKTGWLGLITSNGTVNYNEVEFYQKSATAQQSLANMPAGTYRATLQGFQRPGSNDDVYAAYKSGTDGVNARFYVGASAVNLKNVMAERTATSLHADDKQLANGTYVPNTMASAAAHFAKGYYVNTSEHYLATAGKLDIKVLGTGNTGSSYWLCFTNLRLYSYGNVTAEALSIGAVNDVTATPSAATFDLQGRRVNGSVRGLVIEGGKVKFMK
ncbi:MAG: hypothetical protein E7070_02750 [Bacteroidales bacterium]|nr:hypothetical protein [Bacteroidales bacterium]